MKKEPIRDYLRNEIRCSNCNQVLSCIENDEGGLEANAKHQRGLIENCIYCGQEIDWGTEAVNDNYLKGYSFEVGV